MMLFAQKAIFVACLMIYKYKHKHHLDPSCFGSTPAPLSSSTREKNVVISNRISKLKPLAIKPLYYSIVTVHTRHYIIYTEALLHKVGVKLHNVHFSPYYCCVCNKFIFCVFYFKTVLCFVGYWQVLYSA